jgi:hypothetical protein
MKTKPFVIIVILSLLLIAFITNPDKDKHLQNASQVLMEKAGADNSGLAGIFLELLSKEVARSKVEISNYYLFSVSYVYSEERNKTMNLGLGVFGQVISLVSDEDLKRYKTGSTKTPSKDNQGSKKEADSETQKKLDDLIG